MRFAENSFNADRAACRDGDLRCGIADTLNGFRVLEQIVQPALTVTFGGCGGADAVLRQKLRGGCCKPFYLVGRGVRAELRGALREPFAAMSDAELVERLVSLRGVGRWTVEMFLIYSLERADILPVDDFGVREGYRRLKGLEKAPTPRQMREIGEPWSPHRTTAAWYLWRVPQAR